MGESELKESLRHEGEKQVRAFWQAAEEKVAKRRQELEQEQEQRNREAERRLEAEISRRRDNRLAESRRQAMASRLRAEALLDERLQSLASQLLAEFAEQDREFLWKALCGELPATEWHKVTVSQVDQALAARDFPTAEVEVDNVIVGGLIATSSSGVRIDNSLSCRLRRAWPNLLPQLMNELRGLVDGDETS